MSLETKPQIKMFTGAKGKAVLNAMTVETLTFQLGCIKQDISEKHYERMLNMISSHDSEQIKLVSKIINEHIIKKIKHGY